VNAQIKNLTVRSEFKAEAVIDWIKIVISTSKATQFQHLQSKLRRILDLPVDAAEIFVSPISAGAGNTSNRFEITFHDEIANNWHSLDQIILQLGQRFELSEEPEVSAIEIALDFYCRNANNTGLAELTHRLQTSLAGIATKGSNPRQFDFWNKQNVFLTPESEINSTMNLRTGNKPDLISWQIYRKTTDNNGRHLGSSQHRARAEFTVRGSQLASYLGNIHKTVKLSEIKDFEFAKLAELLHFRRLKPIDEITSGKNKYFRYAINKLANQIRHSMLLYPLGYRAYRRDPRTAQPRNKGLHEMLQHSRHSVADDDLNKTVRVKLRNLTKSFSTKK